MCVHTLSRNKAPVRGAVMSLFYFLLWSASSLLRISICIPTCLTTFNITTHNLAKQLGITKGQHPTLALTVINLPEVYCIHISPNHACPFKRAQSDCSFLNTAPLTDRTLLDSFLLLPSPAFKSIRLIGRVCWTALRVPPACKAANQQRQEIRKSIADLKLLGLLSTYASNPIKEKNHRPPKCLLSLKVHQKPAIVRCSTNH